MNKLKKRIEVNSKMLSSIDLIIIGVITLKSFYVLDIKVLRNYVFFFSTNIVIHSRYCYFVYLQFLTCWNFLQNTQEAIQVKKSFTMCIWETISNAPTYFILYVRYMETANTDVTQSCLIHKCYGALNMQFKKFNKLHTQKICTKKNCSL